MRIAHVSDIHFGRILLPGIVDHLVDDVNGEKADLVVLSGDLTQRARRWQFEAAKELIEAFESPTLVVPGNHDVHAWWRPHARILRPLERFQHYITPDLNPTFERDGVAVLGINSAHGRTIMGGLIVRHQRQCIEDYFAKHDSNTFKVLVVHHHLTRIQALGPHDVARKARKALRTACSAGVDLILCGHLHISHVEPVEIVPLEHRVVIVSAGTATSTRGRKSNRRTNYYNMIDIALDSFTVHEKRYDQSSRCFVTHASTRFRRAIPVEKARGM